MAKKIKKAELEKLQNAVSKINELKLELGNIEAAKHRILHNVAEAENNDLGAVRKELEEKYGQVNINITDGVITEREDESNKED
jgi:archaellum component FlaF (FlaF/FlaG flagellin family)|tara:strand:+ start:3579 stop:3830 length:252 start_codon:yes stop_codon:yes gene_type:complete